MGFERVMVTCGSLIGGVESEIVGSRRTANQKGEKNEGRGAIRPQW